MDGEVWRATVCGAAEWNMPEQLTLFKNNLKGH